MDFENHVILPREDFSDLQEAAWGHNPEPGERVAQTVQSTFVFAALAGAVTAGFWGWAKAIDWLEERNFQRRVRELQTEAVAEAVHKGTAVSA